MTGRPEGSDVDSWTPSKLPDDDADLFRPSEHDGASQAVDVYGASDGVSASGRGWGLADSGRQAPDDSLSTDGDASTTDQSRSRWWTEDVHRPYRDGERVKATRATGGTFISHVPKGTEGRVASTRLGALGGEYATVEFANKYTEEVPLTDIERGKSWWQ